MKCFALLVMVLPFAIGITSASGQRFGAVAVAPRGAAVAVQAGPAGGHVHVGSRFAPSVGLTPAPRGASVVVQGGLVGAHVRSGFAPFIMAPAPVFVAPIAPQPHFRGPHWPRQPAIVHPGIVIIDVPYYSEGIEISQTTPGVVQQERRFDAPPTSEARTRAPGQLAPFDPTPGDVVERMLRLASVKSGDVLYDLGAGDGRVAIAAAKKFGVRAVGYEIDAGLVKLARENVKKHGVEHLVEIRQQDFLDADLTQASVVTLYLSYDGNLALRSKLMNELRPGARVVSYTFDMAEWQAKIAERYRDSAGNTHMIYLWQIGEPLAFR